MRGLCVRAQCEKTNHLRVSACRMNTKDLVLVLLTASLSLVEVGAADDGTKEASWRYVPLNSVTIRDMFSAGKKGGQQKEQAESPSPSDMEEGEEAKRHKWWHFLSGNNKKTKETFRPKPAKLSVLLTRVKNATDNYNSKFHEHLKSRLPHKDHQTTAAAITTATSAEEMEELTSTPPPPKWYIPALSQSTSGEYLVEESGKDDFTPALASEGNFSFSQANRRSEQPPKIGFPPFFKRVTDATSASSTTTTTERAPEKKASPADTSSKANLDRGLRQLVELHGKLLTILQEQSRTQRAIVKNLELMRSSL